MRMRMGLAGRSQQRDYFATSSACVLLCCPPATPHTTRVRLGHLDATRIPEIPSPLVSGAFWTLLATDPKKLRSAPRPAVSVCGSWLEPPVTTPGSRPGAPGVPGSPNVATVNPAHRTVASCADFFRAAAGLELASAAARPIDSPHLCVCTHPVGTREGGRRHVSRSTSVEPGRTTPAASEAQDHGDVLRGDPDTLFGTPHPHPGRGPSPGRVRRTSVARILWHWRHHAAADALCKCRGAVARDARMSCSRDQCGKSASTAAALVNTLSSRKDCLPGECRKVRCSA